MRQHVHFDEADILAQHEKMTAARVAHMELPGSPGAQMRANAALLGHFSVFLAREGNRGTAGDALADAVASVVSNMLLTYALSTAGLPLDGPDAVHHINTVQLRIASNLAIAMRDVQPEDMSIVQPVAAGRA